MAELRGSGRVKLRGRAVIRAYPAGELDGLFDLGLTLAEAQDVLFLEGKLLHEGVAENLVVDDGLELALNMLLDDEDGGLTYCEIGTDNTAPSAGDDDLITGVSRKAWLNRDRSAQTANFSTFFLASESTYDIQEIGNFGGASASASLGTGALFSRWLYDYDNSGGNNDLTVDYSIDAEAG